VLGKAPFLQLTSTGQAKTTRTHWQLKSGWSGTAGAMGPWQFTHASGVISNCSLCPVLEHDDSSSSSRTNSLRSCFLSQSMTFLEGPAGRTGSSISSILLASWLSSVCSLWGSHTVSLLRPVGPLHRSRSHRCLTGLLRKPHKRCSSTWPDAVHSPASLLSCWLQSPACIFLLLDCFGLSLMPLWLYLCPWFPRLPGWMDDVVLVLPPPHPTRCGRGMWAP